MRVDLEIGLLVHEGCNSNREKIEKVMHCIAMLVCFSFCILGLFFCVHAHNHNLVGDPKPLEVQLDTT